MRKEYKISDIKTVLEEFQQQYPTRKRIKFKELEKRTLAITIPTIYNLEEHIRLLSRYISKNPGCAVNLYSEAEVCRILKIRKLTMHQWRKNRNISSIVFKTRTIRYNLRTLLEELEANRE